MGYELWAVAFREPGDQVGLVTEAQVHLRAAALQGAPTARRSTGGGDLVHIDQAGELATGGGELAGVIDEPLYIQGARRRASPELCIRFPPGVQLMATKP